MIKRKLLLVDNDDEIHVASEVIITMMLQPRDAVAGGWVFNASVFYIAIIDISGTKRVFNKHILVFIA